VKYKYPKVPNPQRKPAWFILRGLIRLAKRAGGTLPEITRKWVKTKQGEYLWQL